MALIRTGSSQGSDKKRFYCYFSTYPRFVYIPDGTTGYANVSTTIDGISVTMDTNSISFNKNGKKYTGSFTLNNTGTSTESTYTANTSITLDNNSDPFYIEFD